MTTKTRKPVHRCTPPGGPFLHIDSTPEGKSMTREEFKDETDINNIIERFQKMGVADHFARYAPKYGDFCQPSYQEARDQVAAWESIFHDVPGHIRQKFVNAEQFFTFVNDPANADVVEAWSKNSPNIPPAEQNARETRAEAPQGAENETTTEGEGGGSTVGT